MDIRSQGPLCVDSLLFRTSAGDWTFTVIAKATFVLAPDISPLETERPDEVTTADIPWDPDVPSSPRYVSDLVPFKRYQEVLVTGCAYARPGKPARAVLARLGVAGVEKAIEVRGDCHIEPDGRISKPEPWTSMPLRWERAAGGPGTPNPVGMTGRLGAPSQGRSALPNLWPPGAAESNRQGSAGIIGFGPLAPDWPTRRAHLHRHAATWGLYDLSDRPLPGDFDAAYFNAAPPDQRLSEYTIEDSILLEHLHPQHPRMVTRLEAVAPAATLEVPSRRPVEIPLHCDTLCILSDRGVATLTFRGHVTIGDPSHPGTVVVYFDDSSPTLQRRASSAGLGPMPESFHRPPPGSAGLPFHPVKAPHPGVAGLARSVKAQLPQLTPVPELSPDDVMEDHEPGPEEVAELTVTGAGDDPIESTVTLSHSTVDNNALPFQQGRAPAEALPFKRGAAGPRVASSIMTPPTVASPIARPPVVAPPIVARPITVRPPPPQGPDTAILPYAQAPGAAPATPFESAPPPAISSAPVAQGGTLGQNATLAQVLHERVTLAQEPPPPPALVSFVPAPTPAGAALVAPDVVTASAAAIASEPTAPFEAAPAPEPAPEVPPPAPVPEPPPAPAPPAPAPEEPQELPLPVEAYPVARCGAIAASLDRRPDAQEETLKSEGLDRPTWERLDAHWGSKIDKDLQRSKNELLRAHDAAYVERLEEERGLIAAEEYARLAVAAEVSDPSAVLRELDMPEQAWPRIRRVWIARMARDVKLGRIVRSLMDQLG